MSQITLWPSIPNNERNRVQGVFVSFERPPTKKALKEAAQNSPETIEIQATSMFGDEYSGPALKGPEGIPIHVVGPDPYTSRKWYATITRKGLKLLVK